MLLNSLMIIKTPRAVLRSLSSCENIHMLLIPDRCVYNMSKQRIDQDFGTKINTDDLLPAAVTAESDLWNHYLAKLLVTTS